VCAALPALAVLCGTVPALAADRTSEQQEPQDTQQIPDPGQDQPHNSKGVTADAWAYVTSPLRWNVSDWLWFGGALAAVGVAHQYDGEVRKQYAPAQTSSSSNTYDLQDIVPTAVLLVGTYAYAVVSDSSAGRRETWTMAEAGTFSAAAGFVLKLAAGRERPSQTNNPDLWRSGGASFPSLHSTVAFAVGTVFAESGNDDYRWFRRTLGYGVGILTSYERVKHNQHWVSDTVAGAALGIATASFTMNRRQDPESTTSHLSVAPIDGGAMLAWSRRW
jgi:undecaprenyl-diphosphatase